jgi:hypothetical protein
MSSAERPETRKETLRRVLAPLNLKHNSVRRRAFILAVLLISEWIFIIFSSIPPRCGGTNSLLKWVFFARLLCYPFLGTAAHYRAREEKWQQANNLDSAFLYVPPPRQAQISGTLSPYT